MAKSQCDDQSYESQAKQNQCAEMRYRNADRVLNLRYKQLLSKLSAQAGTNLRQEQREWLQKLEPGCRAPLGPLENAGSMWAMEFYDCMAQETSARTKALASWPAKG
jgi:uncharacterized protein YecT (DUF1311 family)